MWPFCAKLIVHVIVLLRFFVILFGYEACMLAIVNVRWTADQRQKVSAVDTHANL